MLCVAYVVLLVLFVCVFVVVVWWLFVDCDVDDSTYTVGFALVVYVLAWVIVWVFGTVRWFYLGLRFAVDVVLFCCLKFLFISALLAFCNLVGYRFGFGLINGVLTLFVFV